MLRQLVDFWQEKGVDAPKKTICKALSVQNKIPFEDYYFANHRITPEDIVFFR
jgi:hypothetical protein